MNNFTTVMAAKSGTLNSRSISGLYTEFDVEIYGDEI